MPIKKFRAEFGLPDTFQMEHFEAKEWVGLGSTEGAGAILAAVRQQLIDAVPSHITIQTLMPVVDEIAQRFRQELTVANQHIGLRPVEVDFAVSGFYDVMQAAAYRLAELTHLHRQNLEAVVDKFDFLSIYHAWLNDSVRVSGLVHNFQHHDQQFKVRLIYYIYGHVGLEVDVVGEIYYVTDMSMACPASNYMQELCGAVAQALCESLTL
jgi:hypothetical protein